MAETEADTCRKLVVPMLRKAGWDDAPHAINEQRTFTDGRIVFVGGKARRGRQKRADYILRYRSHFPIAVVEAKARYKHAAEGLRQARDYAETLGLKFAYATNGAEIMEIDYTTGVERPVGAFPSPEELWQRQRVADGLTDRATAEKLLAPTYPDRSRRLRYYQEIAVNRALQAVVSGRKCILLMSVSHSAQYEPAHSDVWTVLEELPHRLKALLKRHESSRALDFERMCRLVPFRRLATPEEQAAVVSFLLSDDARWITRQVISTSGGLTMS